MNINVCAGLFLSNDPREVARSEQALLRYLDAHARQNQSLLEMYSYPRLYDAHVRYIAEEGTEDWLDIPHVIAVGWGDCEDLACWRVAELRHFEKLHASPKLAYRETPTGVRNHVIAEFWDKNGAYHEEDPSALLGMGWEEDFVARHPWARDIEGPRAH